MRWEDILSVFSDWRVQFLTIFVVLALAIATILTLVERRIRNNRKQNAIQKAQETFIANIRAVKNSQTTPKEKLDFLDELAKNYFAEIYGTPVHKDYSYLKQYFKEQKQQDIEEFCKLMFTAYYLKKSTENTELNKAYELFISIYTNRREIYGDTSLLKVEEETKKESQEEETQNKQTKTQETKKEILKPTIEEIVQETKKPIEKETKKEPTKILTALKEKIIPTKKEPEKKLTQQQTPQPFISRMPAKQEQTTLPKTPEIQPPTNNQEETSTKNKDVLESERSTWLANLKKNQPKQLLRSAGTYDWLKDVREELNIK